MQDRSLQENQYLWEHKASKEIIINTLDDIITYIRRILKTPSNAVITDALLIDYINRFWIVDVDARLQLFDLKTKYQFLTTPGFDQYNMPLYSVQTETTNPIQQIAMFPVYQGVVGPSFVNGVQILYNTERKFFFNAWSNYNQLFTQVGTGDGTNGPYTLRLPFLPSSTASNNFPLNIAICRGHVDITGIISTGVNQDPPLDNGLGTNVPIIPTTSVLSQVFFSSQATDGTNISVADSGIYLSGNLNYGLLINKGNAPYGNTVLADGGSLGVNYATTQNTINYFTGIATNVYFPTAIPLGMPINANATFYQTGIPRSCLFYNNVITLRTVPDTQYVVEVEAYLTPSAFFNTSNAIPFGYMAEYIARGSARKILSDIGDWDQFEKYEPLFKEQEDLVHIRSLRQFTSTRTQNIYSTNSFQRNANQSFGV